MADLTELIEERLRELGLNSWGTKNALSYFAHSGGRVSLDEAQKFFDLAIQLAEQAADALDAAGVGGTPAVSEARMLELWHEAEDAERGDGCEMILRFGRALLKEATAGVTATEQTRSEKLAAAGHTRRPTGKSAGGLMREDDTDGVTATLPTRITERPMDPGESENHYARHEGYVEGWNECLDAVARGVKENKNA